MHETNCFEKLVDDYKSSCLVYAPLVVGKELKEGGVEMLKNEGEETFTGIVNDVD